MAIRWEVSCSGRLLGTVDAPHRAAARRAAEARWRGRRLEVMSVASARVLRDEEQTIAAWRTAPGWESHTGYGAKRGRWA